MSSHCMDTLLKGELLTWIAKLDKYIHCSEELVARPPRIGRYKFTSRTTTGCIQIFCVFVFGSKQKQS